jgi:hypothetical protein
LDWVASRKRRTRGGHFTVLRDNQIARRTKHSRVTLTARTGIACGARFELAVVYVDRHGTPSLRRRPVHATTPACAEAPPASPPTSVPVAAPASVPAPAPGAQGPPRDAAVWPFASTSPWNVAIGSGAAFGGTSEGRTASLQSVAHSYINASAYSVPVFVAGPSDPWSTLDSPGDSVDLRVPAAAEQDSGSDGSLVIIDPSHTIADEMWVASRSGSSSWYARFHKRSNLRGPGVTEDGARASGFSLLGGLIRRWDVEQGAIRHALVMAVPSEVARQGYVWPATREDGYASQYGGNIPLGSLFAIPPGVDIGRLGLSPAGLMLAKALQDYGVYVGDTTAPGTARNVALYAEPTADDLPQLEAMRNDLDTLHRQLRAVVNSGPQTIGGGGTPRQPLAGPVG